MKTIKFYYAMVYGLTGIGTILAVICVDYVNPAFYTYDMCSKSYMDSRGHPNMYDQPNAQELISTCNQVKTIFLNPLVQFGTCYPIMILTMVYMVLGPKKEFLSNNPPELHSIFYNENKPTEITVCPSCNTSLNGMAWCGTKKCTEFWREKFEQQ